MSAQTNPPFNFDVTIVITDFDPSRMAKEFTKFTGNFKLPVLDFESAMVIHHKNVEALFAANKAVTEGRQNIATPKAASEKALAEQREPADMVTKSSKKAITLVNQRIRKSQYEIEASSKTYAK